VLRVFEEMPVIDPGTIKFGRVNPAQVHAILVEKHGFSPERVENSLSRVVKEQTNTQKGLGEWF
jgi:hypothetical protein